MNRPMQSQNPRSNAGAMLLIGAVLATATVILADDKPDVPFPNNYRSWQHVKSVVVGSEHKSFPTRGGIHHFYANEKALEGYRMGKFPNGSVLVDEGVLTKDGEGESKGIVQEGDRRSLDVMVKNDQLYRETGGWGFEHFDRDNKTGVLPASGRANCYACHAKQKDRDHVFSTVRK